MEDDNSIRVACRVRPFNPREQA
jgi:kinesin family protein 5